MRIEPVTGWRDRRTYTLLPYRLHGNEPDWVPPLRMDEWRNFSSRNLATRYCDHARWLARDERGRPIGRIAAIINRRYNELRNEHWGRFAELECPDDPDVAGMLLDAACDWVRARGMTSVIGPQAWSDQDPEGFLIDGFQERTSIATYQNPAYIPLLMDRLGWEKHNDYVVYKVPVPEVLPRAYQVVQRRLRGSAFEVVEFARRSELKPYIRPVLRLMNECFAGVIEGYAPLDDEEIDDLARRYLPIIDPRFVKAVRDGKGLAAFVIAMPDMTAGLKKSGGRLLPTGWWHLLRAPRHAKRLDLLLGGIRPDVRGRGVDVLMGSAFMATARAAGFEYLDSHHELESNRGIRAEMEAMGGVVYKRFRIYRKEL
ncbi:MAG: hypothetical protein FIB01_05825 [Gemmatimonadetes bacterium]|nr:hypothetical protein [Gemmatimonadota bacterium]